MKVYLDHAATTPTDSFVIKEMAKSMKDGFGNPSSLHCFGREERTKIEEVREKIASFLGCRNNEIIFTGGGSEADNLAIRGLIAKIAKKFGIKPHIITSAYEHHAVLDTVKELEKDGKVEASYIEPEKDGVIDPKKIYSKIRDNTVLISIMYVNNEVGSINRINEIGSLVEKKNKGRNSNKKIYFHVDAVQAVEYCDINVEFLKCDLMSLAAHKFYGPKGVGILFVRDKTPIEAEITGGGQEMGLRAGTENVAGIVGMSKAIELIAKERENFEKEENISELVITQESKRIKELRDYLYGEIYSKIQNVKLNGGLERRVPSNLNVSFLGVEGEAIILMLDNEGIAVSSGSACTSGSIEPSHVLLSMGIPAEEAHGSIRFSLGRDNTKEQIDEVLRVLPKVIERLRAMAPDL